VLPGKVLRVQHESVVEHLEDNVRRVLESAGWSSSLRVWNSTRPSAACAPPVPSGAQPIYKEGIDQWRNFEPWLGPLKAVLGTWRGLSRPAGYAYPIGW